MPVKVRERASACRKGFPVAVKVFMKRVPQAESLGPLFELLRELRILAMSQRGYISGETLLSPDDKSTNLVISVWASMEDWKRYERLPKRKAILDRLEPILAQPETIEIWSESPVIIG